MPNIALITGASSGIGRALARYHASKGGDQIVVARRKERLTELKTEIEAEFGTKVWVMAEDIGSENGVRNLYARVQEAGHRVNILINNAGFGGLGIHTERPLAEELAMIDLNVRSLVLLTHMFGNDMVSRGDGKILNVGSTAGMMPGPLQAVYFASKAFVNSYSQAVDEELRAKGVTCTVLAPGAVETEFFNVADMQGIDLVKGAKSPDSVAKIGYEGMLKGKLVVINEWPLRIAVNWLVPFAPRRLVLKLIRKMQTK